MYIRFRNRVIPIETISFGKLPKPIDTPFGVDESPTAESMHDAYNYSASNTANPPSYEEAMRPWTSTDTYIPEEFHHCYYPDDERFKFDSYPYPYPPIPPYKPSRHILYFAVYVNGKILNAYERKKDAEALLNDIITRMEAKNQIFPINFPLNYSELFRPFKPEPRP